MLPTMHAHMLTRDAAPLLQRRCDGMGDNGRPTVRTTARPHVWTLHLFIYLFIFTALHIGLMGSIPVTSKRYERPAAPQMVPLGSPDAKAWVLRRGGAGGGGGRGRPPVVTWTEYSIRFGLASSPPRKAPSLGRSAARGEGRSTR